MNRYRETSFTSKYHREYEAQSSPRNRSQQSSTKFINNLNGNQNLYPSNPKSTVISTNFISPSPPQQSINLIDYRSKESKFHKPIYRQDYSRSQNTELQQTEHIARELKHIDLDQCVTQSINEANSNNSKKEDVWLESTCHASNVSPSVRYLANKYNHSVQTPTKSKLVLSATITPDHTPQ